MAVYKKKHKKIFSSAPRAKKSIAKAKNENKTDNKVKSRFLNDDKVLKIVKGRKLEQKRKTKIGITLIGFVVVLILIFELSFPVGINDSLENFFSKMGAGSYPIDTYGTSLIDVKSANNYCYVLTDSKMTAYNSSGKELISFAHGYEKPAMKKSATRVIVFEQGGQNGAVFNLSGEKSKIKLENEIITANISRCGVYAIATKSEQYSSAVSVYDINDNLIYEWYSAEDIVNNVAVSPNGKKIAVSTINAVGGEFVSKILILEFDSADPVFSKEYKGNVIYSIDTTHNSGFWCVLENSINFVRWSGKDIKDYSSEYSLSHFVANSGGAVAVFNRIGDKTDSKIIYFNKSGKKKTEFDFSGEISDVSLRGGHIYCVSDNNVFLLSKKGDVLRKTESKFGADRIFVLSTYEIAVIDDNAIEKIKFK